MKTKDFILLEKRLLPDFPGFSIRGSLMFISPLAHTLRGFSFEPSGFDKTPFYVTVFFQPMYVPGEHLVLNFGRRLKNGGSGRWQIQDAGNLTALTTAMQKEVPFLLGLQTPNEVASAIQAFTRPNELGHVNPHSLEALAYALILAGDTASAADVSEPFCAGLIGLWLGRTKLLLGELIEAKLAADGTESALEVLRTWESQTIRNLHLEEFA